MKISKLISAAFFLASQNIYADNTKLNLAYPIEGTIMNAQVGLVLERTDILKKHGFDAKVTPMGTGRELKSALVSGQADVIMTSETNFIILLGNGFDCVAINSIGSAGRIALAVKANSKYKKIDDLKGQKAAAIFGTSGHQPLVEWVNDEKLQNEVQIVDIGSVAAMNAALATQSVAGIMSFDPFLQNNLSNGQLRIIKERQFNLITIGSRSFVNNKDVVNRLNEAFRDAIMEVVNNKEKVNGWFSEKSKMSISIIDSATKYNLNYMVKKSQDISLNLSKNFISDLERQAIFLNNQKIINQRPDVKKYIFELALKK
jgi:ABC-type nitrate/sulfonate/bicarbonate transport system substrate-binding protein